MGAQEEIKERKKKYKKKFIFNGTKYCLDFQIYNYQILKKILSFFQNYKV